MQTTRPGLEVPGEVESVQMRRRASSRRLGKKHKKEDKSNMPPHSAWRQQRLPHYKYVPVPKSFITAVVVVALFCFVVGGVFLKLGSTVQSYSVDYTDCVSKNGRTTADGNKAPCKDLTNQPDVPCICKVQIHVEKDMQYPVSLSYGMHNYYQNHRRYIRSRYDVQYRMGRYLFTPQKSTTTCGEIAERDGKVIAPCGATARTLFNDTFVMWKDGLVIPTSPVAIAVASDAKMKYRNPGQKENLTKEFEGSVRPLNWQFMGSEDISIATYGNEDVGFGLENQDFMIWMRNAAFPNWKKIYRKLTPVNGGALKAGNYTIRLEYNYPAVETGATKQVHLEELTNIGGRSRNIGTLYLATAGVLTAVSVGLLAIHFLAPRELGDTSLLVPAGM